jgi:hypothetical protein
MSKIETNTIDTISGTTNLTIGSTNSSTVTFENGSCTGHMYPAFEAHLSADQSGNSDGSTVLVQLNSEILDTNSAFDTSTYTFTCPVAGKYFVYASNKIYCPSNRYRAMNTNVYKNGSSILTSVVDLNDHYFNDNSNNSVTPVCGIIDLAVNDTLKLYAFANTNASATFTIQGGRDGARLGAYRIGA